MESHVHARIEPPDDLLHLLSSEKRRHLLIVLSGGEMLCVNDLASFLHDDASALSQNLKKLRNAGLVAYERNKHLHLYQLTDAIRLMWDGDRVHFNTNNHPNFHLALDFELTPRYGIDLNPFLAKLPAPAARNDIVEVKPAQAKAKKRQSVDRKRK